VVSLLVDATVGRRLAVAQRRRLRRRVSRMVRAAALSEGAERELELAVRLCDDATMRGLNRKYRRKDRPTDVLAFPQRGEEGHLLHPELLGDIVISVETAARQARRGLFGELLLLCAHGLCHLLGHDHGTEAEEAEMRARTRRLLREAGRRGPTRAA
jgi:probable rRNA maturation factor